MDTASTIREFLDENSIAAVRSVEIAYKYHAELETGCRLTGCEIIMRAVDEDVFVRVELPISVMTKETRGVVKYLADLNKKRVEEGKQGYFDLDYVAGKIIFGIRVRQPVTTEILKDVAHYCVDQIEYESDDLLKVVCDECEAVLQEEEEARQRLEKENREPSMFALLMRRLKEVVRNKLDPDSARKNVRFGLPGGAPTDESETPAYAEAGYEPESEPAAEEPVQPEPEKAENELEPDFESLLKTLKIDCVEVDEQAGEESGDGEPDANSDEEPAAEDAGSEAAPGENEPVICPDPSEDDETEEKA